MVESQTYFISSLKRYEICDLKEYVECSKYNWAIEMTYSPWSCTQNRVDHNYHRLEKN